MDVRRMALLEHQDGRVVVCVQRVQRVGAEDALPVCQAPVEACADRA